MKTSKPVSEKNTKQEILEAYQSVLDQLENNPVSPVPVAALTKTNKNIASTIKQESDQLKATLDESLDALYAQMDETIKLLTSIQQAAEAQRKNLELEKQQIINQRNREQEEYSYQFNRQRIRQEEELKEQKQKAESLIAEGYAKLKSEEDEIQDLRKQVQTFEERLQKAVNEAIAQTTKELTGLYGHESALYKQDAKAKESLFEQKIVSLEQIITSQQKEIERLDTIANQANQQMTRIAERAVTKSNQEVSTQATST